MDVPVVARARPPRVDAKKKLSPQDLPEDLAVDLWAFCEAHYGAPEARVVRTALRSFIDSQLANEPRTRQRFDEAKAQRLKRADNIRSIDGRANEPKASPST